MLGICLFLVVKRIKLKKTLRDTSQMKQKYETAAAAESATTDTSKARICSNGGKKYDMNQMTAFVKKQKEKNIFHSVIFHL